MNNINLSTFIISVFSGAIRLAVPILLPALGENFAERSGVINLGTEGVMLLSALVGFAGAFLSESIWIGILLAIVSGIILNIFFGYLVITIRANQVVTGFGINVVMGGLTIFLYRLIFGIRTTAPSVPRLPDLQIPILNDIPIIGQILFSHNPLVYIAFALIPISSYVLYKTKFGLAIRAVGENPEAADTKGINVFAIRYMCLIIHGILAGFGGAFLSLAFQGTFFPNMTAGRGFIAIAVVVLAHWDPKKIIWSSLLFGGSYALGLRLQALDLNIPYQLFLSLPYLLTLAVLIGVSTKAKVPSALTVPYSRGHQD